MSEQELLDYLLKEIEKSGFEVVDVDFLPVPAAVNVDSKVMIYNSKEASPFEIAHELIHIINKDNHRGSYFDATNPQEVRANHEAVLLLWEIFEANGGSFEYFNVYINITHAPFELAESIIKTEYMEMHKAINEIFEDEIHVKLNKEQMRQYITDYISYFDVIESINIYHFLDYYHINYNYYDMAEEEFRNILESA